QAKMDKKHQALCWHECGKRGTLLHLLWECPAVKTLWLDVISFLSESLDFITFTSSVFFTVLFYTADLGSAQHLAWQSRSLRSGSTLPPSCLTPCILDSVEKH
uniref:Uncharacterized protein n=1 Tax=Gadus morhua TaxID=8049 RepID=A0A8C5CTR6_GADMO